MISSFPISLGLSISLFIVLRFFIRNKSSALIASTISIILFSILIPDVASTSNKYWGILPDENFTSQDALRLHVFFSSLAILVLVMSFLEILLLTRKIRMTKSRSLVFITHSFALDMVKFWKNIFFVRLSFCFQNI